MTDTPKPPMVVWLTGKQLPCEAVGRHHSIWAEQGPYVHLDQFVEEVKKRAAKLFGQSFHTATQADCFRQAVRELAKEIKEQK